MARRTHKPEYAREDIRRRINIFVPPPMLSFLEIEAKRLTKEKGKLVRHTDIVRALITSYYEKRLAGLLVSPDD